MRVRVIFNPMANHGQNRRLMEKIDSLGTEYGQLDVVATEHPGHAIDLTRAAINEGYDIVTAAGGDGTVHELVNALVQEGRSPVALGIIPIGSGNDFAFGMNMDGDLETSVKRLFTGRSQLIDVLKIEDDHGQIQYVNNGLGIGFDATINIQSRLITRVHGFAMYALATLRTIALYYQTPHLKIIFDDETIEQDALFIAVGNGPRIGGGFYLTPDAQMDDGLLDSCTVNPVGRATMLYMLPKVMRGTHVTSRHVTMRRNQVIRITSDQPLPIHVDGEIFAYPENDVHEVHISVLPAILRVINQGE